MAAGESPLDNPMSHSLDSDQFHFPFEQSFDIHQWTNEQIGNVLQTLGLEGLTKFMVLEFASLVIGLLMFAYLAANMRFNKGVARGAFANLLEVILVFIREQIAWSAIGKKDGDKFVPYLWSVFFFILTNNLLGMFPWMGSPTGALGCTLALAACTFVVTHGSGVLKFGPIGYAKVAIPHVPAWLLPIMVPVEVLGYLIKPVILAFRLFINILAGHTVLFVILSFIVVVGASPINIMVTPASVIGTALLSVLELFVAFLQAYIFTFLSALFIGGAVHPHH